jgi:histidyl-tRNA synthetase
LNEVELVQIFDAVLTILNLPGFTIKINNRKILTGIAEVSGEADRIVDITVAIDKLDKIGEEGVLEEMKSKGISENAIERIKPLFQLSGSNIEKIKLMKDYLKSSEIGLMGIEELEFVLNSVDKLGLEKGDLEFDVTLARGLNYYTGAIFEVKAHDVKMGSICGGGRYDDLTGLFGLKGLSGVGISFGADRIYDVLNELNLFPKEVTGALTLLFINFGDKEISTCLELATSLRKLDVDCEVYPSSVKLQKQLKYANDRGVKYTVLIGENELKSEKVVLKNMDSGEQSTMSYAEFLNLTWKN